MFCLQQFFSCFKALGSEKALWVGRSLATVSVLPEANVGRWSGLIRVREGSGIIRVWCQSLWLRRKNKSFVATNLLG